MFVFLFLCIYTNPATGCYMNKTILCIKIVWLFIKRFCSWLYGAVIWLAGSLFTSAVFLACVLWSVDLYDAICCWIVSILQLSECVIKNVIIILQSARQTRTKWRHVNKREL